MLDCPYGLTCFTLRFGLLQVKAYTKGEHVLRFEATVHNARDLRCPRGLDNLPAILTRLAGMATQFAGSATPSPASPPTAPGWTPATRPCART